MLEANMRRAPWAFVQTYWQDGAWHVLPKSQNALRLDATYRSAADGPVISASSSAEQGVDKTVASWRHRFYRFEVAANGSLEVPCHKMGDVMDAIHRKVAAGVAGVPYEGPAPSDVKAVRQEYRPDAELVSALEALLQPLVERSFLGGKPRGVLYIA